jgi:predicted O-methyltransferase YrrM
MTDASQKSSQTIATRALMQRISLADDALPAGGNWYPEDKTLEAVLDLIDALVPRRVVILGGGLSVAVFARAMRDFGEIWLVDHDPQIIEITQDMLAKTDAHAPVHVIEAELQEYDKHNLWYDRHVLGGIPNDIDLMFIDGPPHFCGRTPRYPSAPELFDRLAPNGLVVLDKAQRVKEKKALARWETEFPHLGQSRLKCGGGAVVLSATKTS